MTEQTDQVDSTNTDVIYTQEDEGTDCQPPLHPQPLIAMPPLVPPGGDIGGDKIVSVSVVVERPNGTKQIRELAYPDSHCWASELYKRLSEYVDPNLSPFPIFLWNIKEGV